MRVINAMISDILNSFEHKEFAGGLFMESITGLCLCRPLYSDLQIGMLVCLRICVELVEVVLTKPEQLV